MKALLENPHLADLVRHLDVTTHPERDMEAAMQEPIFQEFVDACLRVVQPEKYSTLNET